MKRSLFEIFRVYFKRAFWICIQHALWNVIIRIFFYLRIDVSHQLINLTFFNTQFSYNHRGKKSNDKELTLSSKKNSGNFIQRVPGYNLLVIIFVKRFIYKLVFVLNIFFFISKNLNCLLVHVLGQLILHMSVYCTYKYMRQWTH